MSINNYPGNEYLLISHNPFKGCPSKCKYFNSWKKQQVKNGKENLWDMFVKDIKIKFEKIEDLINENYELQCGNICKKYTSSINPLQKLITKRKIDDNFLKQNNISNQITKDTLIKACCKLKCPSTSISNASRTKCVKCPSNSTKDTKYDKCKCKTYYFCKKGPEEKLCEPNVECVLCKQGEIHIKGKINIKDKCKKCPKNSQPTGQRCVAKSGYELKKNANKVEKCKGLKYSNTNSNYKCTKCKKGEQIYTNNKKLNIKCTKCPENLWNDGTHKECQQCGTDTTKLQKELDEIQESCGFTPFLRKFMKGKGSTKESDCKGCPKNQYRVRNIRSEYICIHKNQIPNTPRAYSGCFYDKQTKKLKKISDCPKGNYIQLKNRVNWKQKVCRPCPKGKTTNKKGAMSCIPCGISNYIGKSCKGLDGYEIKKNKYIKCDKGLYSSNKTNFNCRPCPNGQTTNKKGAKSCIPCNPGKYVGKSCRGLVGYEIKNNKYQKCEPGKISTLNTGWKCKVPLCKPGEEYDYVNNICNLCKPGTSSSPKGDSKELNFKYGPNKLKDMKCYPCDEINGYYQDSSGQTACKMCRAGGSSTGKKCFKKREIYIRGHRYLRRGNMGNVPPRKGFLCEDLDYLREYKNINSSIKCKELCWKDTKCELSLYKKYPGKSKKKPECYNKTTNYNKVEKKNGEFVVTNKRPGFRDSRKFSSICQNPSKNSNNYMSDRRGIPSDNSRGWKKQEDQSKMYGIIWDRLFFKPVN